VRRLDAGRRAIVERTADAPEPAPRPRHMQASAVSPGTKAEAARSQASVPFVCENSDTPGVRDLLAGFGPRDLDALPVGAGVRTLLDSVQVVLLREGEDQFRLEVWRSFAPHLRALLDLGLREIEAGL
jgi:heterotetrameric sarcosine oxidase gamma subunit